MFSCLCVLRVLAGWGIQKSYHVHVDIKERVKSNEDHASLILCSVISENNESCDCKHYNEEREAKHDLVALFKILDLE